MNEKILQLVCDELSNALTGRRMGAIFSLSRFETAIDFRIESGLFLFVSVEPANPRVYLIRRRMKELARTPVQLSPFLSVLRKYLTGAEVMSVSKMPGERALAIGFSSTSETGEMVSYELVIQMSGRSANMFFLNSERKIIGASRNSDVAGQRPGECYELTARPETSGIQKREEVDLPSLTSVSEFLDAQFLEKQKRISFDQRAAAARQKLNQLIAKRYKLLQELNGDLKDHGNVEQWKRYGDLLLANTLNARVIGDKALVHDLFAEGSPEIEIEVNSNESIAEAAERFYKRYAKARNAAVEIAKRLNSIRAELTQLENQRALLESAIAAGDESFFEPTKKTRDFRTDKRKSETGFNGARRFISSDGIEILVGKKSTDNDQLTFRFAKSLDFWLHAADYPGSHVVVRNPNRKLDIPQKTLLESAQLAAFYSTAKSQPKAAVNYTQKKFVSKPKGGAPGLARLSKFKTILVEPQVPPGVKKID